MKLPIASGLITAAVSLGLLAGCSTQAPPTVAPKAPDAAGAAATTAPAAPPPTTAAKTAPAAAPTTSAAAPSPAAKAAAPAASPVAAAKVEPKGKLTYALHFALTPRWLDPSTLVNKSDLIVSYALHDAMVKPMPGNRFTPSLAESYEIAPDFKTATFRLRPGVKFHDGSLITSEDVKFSYELYKGNDAKPLKDKIASIETPDARTTIFRFKEPFLDFMELYGTYGTGAAWILPAKYYQQVGEDGYRAKPIGAGPYKFVSQVVGESMEFEAWPDYWRKTPSVKFISVKGIPDNSTRLAALKVGEVDAITGVLPLEAEQIKADAKLALGAAQSTNYWIAFPGRDKPTSPFHDKRVRQAVSLALDRDALNQFHTGGLGETPGNWITRDFVSAIDLPKPEYNVAKAKQLLAEAGYPDGFDAGAISPSSGRAMLLEFMASQLREVGIRGRMNIMERVAFDQKAAEGISTFPDGIISPGGGSSPNAAAAIRVSATCKGSQSMVCDPFIDERIQKHDASVDPQERDRLVKEIQTYMTENYILVPLLRNTFVNAQGPRIANKPADIWGNMDQWLYLGPFEDVMLKE